MGLVFLSGVKWPPDFQLDPDPLVKPDSIDWLPDCLNQLGGEFERVELEDQYHDQNGS